MKQPFSKETDFRSGYVLVVDKPLGWTSTDVVRRIKFMLRRDGFKNLKVGHAGTLDPLATGVLIVCLGKATKQVETLQAEEKEYVADLRLGASAFLLQLIVRLVQELKKTHSLPSMNPVS